MIHRQVVVRLGAELFQLLFIRSRDPTGRVHVDRIEYALHAVLILQPESNDFELQLSHGAEYQIIITQGFEQLRRALLAQLRQPLGQRLHLQGILEYGTAEYFRREVGNTRERKTLTVR